MMHANLSSGRRDHGGRRPCRGRSRGLQNLLADREVTETGSDEEELAEDAGGGQFLQHGRERKGSDEKSEGMGTSPQS
jgi:hypothetical protein